MVVFRYTIPKEQLNIEKIAESGQCFSWHKREDGSFSISTNGRYMEMRQDGDTIYSSEPIFEGTFWYHYFSIDEHVQLKKYNDTFLNEAIKFGEGIRILKQPLWETVISFIISQRKNIPAIQDSIFRFSQRFGEIRVCDGLDRDGIWYYTFPTYDKLKNISIEDLQGLGLGYRDEYILHATQNWEQIEEQLRNATTKEEVYQILTSMFGVGKKVANCVLLFADWFHYLDVCPIDVWMQKVIDRKYNGIVPEWMNDTYAGLFQQFVFYYVRKNPHTLDN